MTRQRPNWIEGYEFSDCCVRSREILGFVGQKWLNNDPLELRETAYFSFFPNDPPSSQWSAQCLGESLGIDICATFIPEEKWCFVLKDGLVFTSGGGSGGWEKEIPGSQTAYFNNVRSINNGHAIAVGTGRRVYIREAASSWRQLKDGLFPDSGNINQEKVGFLDIAGFSETDMYACGRNGDLWRFNGTVWTQIDLPTNSVLKKICCSKNGYVYIITDSRDIWYGREDTWSVIHQEETQEVLENIVEYNEEIIVSTVSELFHIEKGIFQKWNAGIPSMISKAHISSNDGVLLVAGRDEAVFYDGRSWQTILEPA